MTTSVRVSFKDFLATYPVILVEGAVIERLRRSAGVNLDEHVMNSALIYNDEGRSALEAICCQYLEIGLRYHLPLLLSTHTWRVIFAYPPFTADFNRVLGLNVSTLRASIVMASPV